VIIGSTVGGDEAMCVQIILISHFNNLTEILKRRRRRAHMREIQDSRIRLSKEQMTQSSPH
jgi:hypothetical protein